MRPNSGKGWLGRLMSSRCWWSINEMVIVGKTSFRVREPCPSFYLFGCLYYTIRASRFTRGGGILRRPLQRKQRKHRTFLTLFLYTILKYLFIKILCFRCSWSINGVIKPFVAAQKLHKTCTNCTELPPAAATPLHLYPESPQKLHPNVQLNAPAPRINSRIFLLVKAKGNNKDRFAHHLKVANRSFSVAETSPARCVSEREKGGKGWLWLPVR